MVVFIEEHEREGLPTCRACSPFVCDARTPLRKIRASARGVEPARRARPDPVAAVDEATRHPTCDADAMDAMVRAEARRVVRARPRSLRL